MMRTTGRYGLRIATLALCTAVIGSVSVRAQDQPAPAQTQDVPPPPPHGGPGGPGGRGGQERRLEMMTKQLNLTSDQVTQIKAIEDESRKEAMAMRDDTSTPREQKRDKAMAMRTAAQAKVRAVLTDEQKTKFDAMEARMKERMQERGPRGSGPDGPPPPPPTGM